MFAASPDLLPRVVLDAGPLIALLHGRDPDHPMAAAGFRQLALGHTRLITPLPIVFEVYKWLLYEAYGGAARVGLQRMRRSLEITYPGQDDVDDLVTLLDAMPAWNGTLEDALVGITGLRLGAPVWTLNFRDLAAFRNLQFWAPDPL